MLVRQADAERQKLNLVVAGTEQGVMMVESEALELSEDVMLGGVVYGHEQMQAAIQAINELAEVAGKPAWELEVTARDGRFEDEGWRVRKDGTRFWAHVVIDPIRNDDGTDFDVIPEEVALSLRRVLRIEERRCNESRQFQLEHAWRFVLGQTHVGAHNGRGHDGCGRRGPCADAACASASSRLRPSNRCPISAPLPSSTRPDAPSSTCS